MTISVSYNFGCTVRETVTSGISGADNPVIPFTAYNESGTLNGSSSPAATKQSQFLLTLSGGAATINFASLTGVNGVTVDATGLRLQFIRIKNLGANTMTFASGASNGISLVCGSIIVPAGGIDQKFLNDAAPDVAAGVRTIDVSGTAAQTAEVTLIFG